MNLLLLLNQDKHCKTALEALSECFFKHEVKIILSRKVGKNDNLPKEILSLIEFEKSDVLGFFEEFNLMDCKDINSVESVAKVKNFAPDLIISIRFGQILREEIISLPRFGVLNLHSGLLPKYRGIMASFWAILRGEKEIGMSLHYILDRGIDTGDIIDISKAEVDFSKSLFWNINGLYFDGCRMIKKAIKNIETDKKIVGLKQAKDGDYFSYPNSDEVQKFKEIMVLV